MPKTKQADKGRNLATQGLSDATQSMFRLIDLMGMCGEDGRVNEAQLTPSLVDTINAELRLFRAQLYSTGLFAIIENVPVTIPAKSKKANPAKSKKIKKNKAEDTSPMPTGG